MGATPDPRLLPLLKRARLRWVALATVRALLDGATAASVALGTIESVRLVGYASIGDPLGSVRVSAATFAVAFAMALAVRLARLPRLRQLATLADRRFGLFDRLTTMLELAQRPSASLSLVARAAIEDGGPHVAALRPSAIVPLSLPRWGWVVPILATTAIALALVEAPPTDQIAASTPSMQGQRVEASVTTDMVRRLADALSRDPETLRDPYLTAVARELQAFSEGLGGDEVIEGADAIELDQLLEHLARATRAREDTVGQALHSLATARLRAPEAPVPSPAAGQEETQGTAVAAPAEDPDAAGDGGAARTEERPIDALLADLAAAIVAAEGRSSVRQPGEAGVECDAETLMYAAVCISPSDVRATPSGLVQQGDAAGNAVGGAEQSDDRAGDAAGDGRQSEATLGSEPEWREVEGESESVVLPDAPAPGDGPRYEVPGLPADQDRTAAEISGIGQLASHRVEEGAMSQQSSGRAYDQVVRRYFLPVPLDGVGSPSERER